MTLAVKYTDKALKTNSSKADTNVCEILYWY
jgi:hypothetical protein